MASQGRIGLPATVLLLALFSGCATNTSGNGGETMTSLSPEDTLGGVVSVYDAIDRAGELLETGTVAYDTLPTLRLGESEVFDLTVVAATGPRATKAAGDALPGVGPAIHAEAPVSESMEAQLIPLTDGLEVEPLSQKRQAIGRRTPAHWRWRITGAEGGLQRLEIELAAVLEAENGVVSTRRTYSATVDVDVTPWQRMAAFFEWLGLPGLITGAALTAFGVWLSRRRSVADGTE